MGACLLSTVRSSFAADEEKKPVPEKFRVKMETSKGDVVIEVHRSLAPRGADRFHELVTSGYYDECRFFRVVPGFVVQWGMNGDPGVNREWKSRKIADDPVKASNRRGTITFATSGPNSRTTQLFINYGDNSRLDAMGFAPFGRVVEGMEVVENITSQYGEQPQQPSIDALGNDYLKKQFPKLDYIRKATILPEETAEEKPSEN
ncbi:MAG: peptidylprolyl isomerase [Planctomycetaceae bacterium]|nr:peptidylprolyl isomerase [Planctomycetaceae bacterium]